MISLLRACGIASAFSVAAFVLIYLVGSFVAMDWNISEWSDKFGRIIIVFVSIGFGVMTTAILAETEDNDSLRLY